MAIKRFPSAMFYCIYLINVLLAILFLVHPVLTGGTHVGIGERKSHGEHIQ